MTTTLRRARLFIVGASFVLTSAYLVHASQPEQIPPRAPFASFPTQIGGWTGQSAPDFERDVLQVLGVDEYVNRYYLSGKQLAHVYIGYYRSQHTGSTIHSPMNCLPGAGWAPVTSGRIALSVSANGASSSVAVNRLIIQKGLDKQVVLYWYQSHGRTIPSEYWSKIYLVLDSIRLNRSDAALVRVIAPIDSALPNAEATAERAAVDLAETMFPEFGRYLPS
jgi:EpsI family protein